jgi:hypothetical protein
MAASLSMFRWEIPAPDRLSLSLVVSAIFMRHMNPAPIANA